MRHSSATALWTEGHLQDSFTQELCLRDFDRPTAVAGKCSMGSLSVQLALGLPTMIWGGVVQNTVEFGIFRLLTVSKQLHFEAQLLAFRGVI